MIKVQKTQNIASIEKYYEVLDEWQRKDCDLLLPKQLHNWRMGGKAALVQFIITWAKRFPLGRLITHVQDSSDADTQLQRLCDEDHGLVGVMMASDIVTLAGDSSLKASAYRFAERRIARMIDFSVLEKSKNAVRGPAILLLCADNTTKAHLPSFYYQNLRLKKQVRSVHDFEELAKRILYHCLSFASNLRRDEFPESYKRSVGKILRELFKNTDDWAKTDHTERRLIRSVRGVIARSYVKEGPQPVDLFKDAEGSTALEAYLRHKELQEAVSRPSFFELSIFDSGPGLALRWLGRPIESDERMEDEYTAVMACLLKHGTSSARTHRGIGLHSVMRTLSERQGFLKIRTGRLSLYRDFVSDPYAGQEEEVSDGEKEKSTTYMLDWHSKTSRLNTMPRAEGTLVTMFIPLTASRVSNE